MPRLSDLFNEKDLKGIKEDDFKEIIKSGNDMVGIPFSIESDNEGSELSHSLILIIGKESLLTITDYVRNGVDEKIKIIPPSTEDITKAAFEKKFAIEYINEKIPSKKMEKLKFKFKKLLLRIALRF